MLFYHNQTRFDAILTLRIESGEDLNQRSRLAPTTCTTSSTHRSDTMIFWSARAVRYT